MFEKISGSILKTPEQLDRVKNRSRQAFHEFGLRILSTLPLAYDSAIITD